jgi:hypothetical protein
MDKIIINVDQEDRLFMEKECEKTKHTFHSFFKMLLDLYKKPVETKELPKQVNTPIAQDEPLKTPKKQDQRKVNGKENSSKGSDQ